MTFWGTKRIQVQLAEIVPGCDPSRVKQGACELSLGGEAFISGDGRKRTLEDGDVVRVEPGATALLLSKERVRIPANAVGFISLKSRLKLPGTINVSGFHVDPGFDGHLVFTVFNAGVERQEFVSGKPTFLLWIADMDEVPDPYRGDAQGQQKIPGQLISKLEAPGVAPADLKKDIEKLRQHHKFQVGILIAILVGVILLVLEGFPFGRIGGRIGDALLPPGDQAPLQSADGDSVSKERN